MTRNLVLFQFIFNVINFVKNKSNPPLKKHRMHEKIRVWNN
jgi:hypothetical protein